MSLFDPPADPSDPDRLSREAERTCDRLRTMALTRLSRPEAGGASRAAAAFEVAQRLADTAADLDGRARVGLPELADPCAGDVVAVCAHDLVAAIEATTESVSAQAAARACRSAVADLVALRRTL